jgi:elongation factor 3
MASAIVSKIIDAAEAPADRDAAVAELGALIKSKGVAALNDDTVPKLIAVMEDGNKKKAPQRAASLAAFSAITENIGSAGDPFVVSMLGAVLKLCADKEKSVREAAEAAGPAAIASLPAYATKTVVPVLLQSMDNSCRSQTVVGALATLEKLAESNPTQVAQCLPQVVPVVSACMVDITDAVKVQAKVTMQKSCVAIDNKDIEKVIPSIIDAVSDISQVPETIHTLASCTFVQTVEGAALAIIVPLLFRGFKEKNTAIKRQCAKIVANMSKLVEHPMEAAAFLPELLPALDKARQEVSDPEARDVCEQAHAQLQRIEEKVKTDKSKKADHATIVALIKKNIGGDVDAHMEKSVDFAAHVVCSLCDANQYEPKAWEKNLKAYLTPYRDGAAVDACLKAVNAQCVIDLAPEVEEEEEEDAEELCNCKFTLAYGSKILLHNTEMKLLRGFRYGLLGGNDSGKTTLMRAIANEQVEGFPPGSELRTVFVEADILGELSDLACIDYIFADARIKAANIPRDEIKNMLSTVGFSEKMIGEPVTFLSGGWRMKLALARAMLQKADILLMDEPTNHLDVLNVQWTMDYINSLKHVTSIIVSHDSKLLDQCCTHIMEIKNLKLNTTKGNLSSFVAANPEAKAYFELKSSKLTFNFPQPGFIEGIKSKGKALMKMQQCEFTYPVNDKPTITDITVQVSLSSRVACVGVNGAGKSTMIKLLTGEMYPTKGTVWKHPNARVAYVAQHAFHHIEQHLTKTPNEYIRWRYEHGEDKEATQKVTMTLTEEEEAICRNPVQIDSTDAKGNPIKIKRVIDRLTGARKEDKKAKEYLYEVAWEGIGYEGNTWMLQSKLEKIGFKKHCKLVDEKVTMREGAYKRPLTQVNVEKHLEDVGLDREFGTHHRMSALSGGQKVKVVLAASLWNQPHIIILDEPTNYLDRESLGALATAIENFEGGVVMITHNNDFCSKLCPETWVLERKEDGIGHLDCKGDPEWMKNVQAEKVEFKAMEEMVDAFGNTVKVKAPKKVLSRQEKKKRAKIRAAKIARGEEVSDDEDEDWE